jgi:hypothetical protein
MIMWFPLDMDVDRDHVVGWFMSCLVRVAPGAADHDGLVILSAEQRGWWCPGHDRHPFVTRLPIRWQSHFSATGMDAVFAALASMAGPVMPSSSKAHSAPGRTARGAMPLTTVGGEHTPTSPDVRKTRYAA